MSKATDSIIGAPVVCTDRPYGRLERAVIDPESLMRTLLSARPHFKRRSNRRGFGVGHLLKLGGARRETRLAYPAVAGHAQEVVPYGCNGGGRPALVGT